MAEIEQKGRGIGVRKGFWWNTAAVTADAMQSMVILSCISYRLGIGDAGIFSIGYALANLIATVARYGVRNYQVTDQEARGIFQDYVVSRILTVCLSWGGVSVYLLFCHMLLNYSLYKMYVIWLICLYKLIDAMEDVFVAFYQQQGALEKGAGIMAVRLTSSTGILCGLLLLTGNMIVTLWSGILFSAAVDVMLFGKQLKGNRVFLSSVSIKNVKRILKDCSALAVATSISMYVGNISKYMIDWYMSEEIQAIFGYLMMPTFCIVLLSRFIYQPMVRNIGILWQTNERKSLRKIMFQQMLFILAVTIPAILIGILFGIPVLNLLFNVNLEAYKTEFAVLFLGGALYAISSFFSVLLTVMRKQRVIADIYIAVSVCALVSGKNLLGKYGIRGASVLYFLVNLGIGICFMILLLKYLREKG